MQTELTKEHKMLGFGFDFGAYEHETMTNGVVVRGDCMEVMKVMGDNSVDLVCTDLPYGELGSRTNGGIKDRHYDDERSMIADTVDFDMTLMLEEAWRVCRGSFYFFCGIGQISAIHNFFRSKGCTTRLIVWEKTNPVPTNGQWTWLFGIEPCVFAKKAGAVYNGNCRNTVLRYPIAAPTFHATPKNENLMRDLVETSTVKGDIVLDMFAGGMTTGVACVRGRRRYVMVERDADYYREGVKRLVGVGGMQIGLDFGEEGGVK